MYSRNQSNLPKKGQLMLTRWMLALLLLMGSCGCDRMRTSQIPEERPISNDNTKAKKAEILPTDQPGGITNLGATCYMNALLQVIAAHYHDIFDEDRKELVKAVKEVEELASVGREVVDTINSGQTVERKLAQKFFKALNEVGWEKQSNMQEDPHELMQLIFSKLALPKAGEASEVTNSITKENKYRHDPTSIIMTSMPSEKGSIDMEKILANYFITEKLYDYKWHDKDTVYSEAEKRLKLYNLDRLHGGILPILVKRYAFDFESREKDKDKETIKDPFYIIIKEDFLLIQGKKGRDIPYELVGAIVHKGDGIDGGHYVALVKRGNKWYCTNDSNVSEVSEEAAKKAAEEAYLFFYKPCAPLAQAA